VPYAESRTHADPSPQAIGAASNHISTRSTSFPAGAARRYVRRTERQPDALDPPARPPSHSVELVAAANSYRDGGTNFSRGSRASYAQVALLLRPPQTCRRDRRVPLASADGRDELAKLAVFCGHPAQTPVGGDKRVSCRRGPACPAPDPACLRGDALAWVYVSAGGSCECGLTMRLLRHAFIARARPDRRARSRCAL
jgi:hypothetical protein